MKNLLILMGAVLLGMAGAACDNDRSRSYSVGVINIAPMLNQTVVGFKKGMAELGYIEGKNIRYLSDGRSVEMSKLSAEIRTLLAAKVDLILTITTPATLAAMQATAGTDLPVVFTVVTDPLGAGIVESMQHPGGNITGVAFGIAEARRLEWLLRIAPEIKHIYAPFNPKDKSPVLALKMVRKAAARLGVNLITREVHDPESLKDAVLNIPAEADAVFHLPDSFIGTRLSDLVTEATKRNLPVSAANIINVESHHMLTSFGVDLNLCGKQAARLVDKILKGDRPADLPVEMTEFYLAINLKTANAIDLAIPDEILRQADIIIR